MSQMLNMELFNKLLRNLSQNSPTFHLLAKKTTHYLFLLFFNETWVGKTDVHIGPAALESFL